MRHALALLFAGLLVLTACSDESGEEAAPSAEAPEGVPGAVAIRAPGSRQHTEAGVDYPTRPPIGGDHHPVWVNCKFYGEPIPDESAVHSLEHGAVWVAYASDAPNEELQTLAGRIDQETHLMASPYDDLPTTYVASAWERQLEFDSLDDPAFEAFLGAYLEGPTTPEPGAACSGGAG